ncbi:hypothetical protein [Nocardioides bruguierae]|uniref:Uncharacterized protein n=1 Tax=Nocardioides bruguierae TaxID=2945102 RepID=A0A9X2D8T5_9ACTN|nr:hypothetical protein [Nocardioides bruguierae]MCM0620174.1 hypothetical protein [Nocardioides bruguierae]
MNSNDLHDRLLALREDLDLPETRVAEGAWETGRTRQRRRRAAGAVAGVAAVAVIAAGTALVGGGTTDAGRIGPASTVPSTSLPSATATSGPVTPMGEFRGLGVGGAVVTRAGLGGLAEEAASVTLQGRSAGTVSEAIEVVGGALPDWAASSSDGVLICWAGGEQALVADPTQQLRPDSFSPTGALLATFSDQGLEVLDLVDGGGSTYPFDSLGDLADVGPDALQLTWADDEHLLIAEARSAYEDAGTPRAVLLDAVTGDVTATALSGGTVYLDGSPIVLHASRAYTGSTVWWSRAGNLGMTTLLPLAADGLVAGSSSTSIPGADSAEAGRFTQVEVWDSTDFALAAQLPVPNGTHPAVLDLDASHVLASLRDADGTTLVDVPFGAREGEPVTGVLRLDGATGAVAVRPGGLG